MHKFSSSDSFLKLHLIVSSIGTFKHNLSCFLCDLLSPLAPNEYTCKDIFLLFLKLRMQIFSNKKFLVSYDVTSLLTNIPLQQTIEIDIAVNLIFNPNPTLNITRKELKNYF